MFVLVMTRSRFKSSRTVNNSSIGEARRRIGVGSALQQ
jgi:hypothetical protein